MIQIRIIKTPKGEAPLWVRDAWVGIEFASWNRKGIPITVRAFGVLSAPKGLIAQILGTFSGKSRKYRGFIVKSQVALAALEKHNPAAAKWWYVNTPHLIGKTKCLLFQADECEVIAGAP